MAGERVDAVEFEVFVEMREAEEALERRLLHLFDVAEAHVIFDEGEDLCAVLVGEAQAAEDFVGDANANLDVAVEADAVGRLVGEGSGLWPTSWRSAPQARVGDAPAGSFSRSRRVWIQTSPSGGTREAGPRRGAS